MLAVIANACAVRDVSCSSGPAPDCPYDKRRS